MTNPTSNFGWQMPTPTDLVTDLPADFEVFGQAVDTSLADLKGGTTGQVLTKTSNTNMDFVWTTPTAAVPEFNEQVFTSSGTFTPATGVTKVLVEIVSGGGGGGCDGTRGGGGGAAGGTLNQLFTVTPGTGVTVTVGAGGAARAPSGTGNAGSVSSFAGTSAEAGPGGTREIATNVGDRISMSSSAIGSGKKTGQSGTANGGAGGAGSDDSGISSGAGGSGRVTVRWLA